MTMDYEQRILAIESSIHDLFSRMGAVEDKTKSAWNTIREINTKVDCIEKRMASFEEDMKQVKGEQKSMTKMLKGLMILISITSIISVALLIYLCKHDTTLTSDLATAWKIILPLLPK